LSFRDDRQHSQASKFYNSQPGNKVHSKAISPLRESLAGIELPSLSNECI